MNIMFRAVPAVLSHMYRTSDFEIRYGFVPKNGRIVFVAIRRKLGTQAVYELLSKNMLSKVHKKDAINKVADKMKNFRFPRDDQELVEIANSILSPQLVVAK